jgi:hypothetical protein
MKTKKFNKKLVVNKKTVANLNINDMRSAHGGAHTYNTYCPECPPNPSWVSCEACTEWYCPTYDCPTGMEC